jgi:DNA processing protein
MLNSLSHDQIATITLWYLVQHSLSSFQKLQQHFGTSTKAVAASNHQIWPNLGLHKSHLQRVVEIQTLRTQILENNGCIITEFLPQTPPLKRNFPRRNRIVSALSLGVVVAEAALKSGSLGTAKSAAEQGKTIFAIPGHIYSEHHQGCHQLIREGAILVDHPEQIIEDLALPTQWHSQSQAQETTPSASIEIPSDLLELYNQLDWVGQNMDQLNFKLNIDIATLTSQLMELEILGLAQQQAGNYLRCRSNQ